MKNSFTIIFLIFVSISLKGQIHKVGTVIKDSTTPMIAPIYGQIPKVGTAIQGDFDGDGKKEFAFVVQTKEGYGNPSLDGIPNEYSVYFSNDKIKPFTIGCCFPILINKGDLNNDGKDEITVYLAPYNGCTYYMETYSFVKGSWKQIIEGISVPTYCNSLSDEDLQNRIFKENGTIFFYDVDFKSNSLKLIKKKAIIKN